MLKQFIGFIIILLTLPALLFVQRAIAHELTNATTFKTQMAESIELVAPIINVPVVMKDRNGSTFSEEYVEWRQPLPLSSIPTIMQQLFLESEDTGFYEHNGYDLAAIVRAFTVNSSSDGVKQGGSTITQQVVRMRFLSPDKTYERKLTEIFYAAELERQYTKEEILEMYMNEMYFGNQVYGVGAAATYYFSKSINELTLAEMAFLASIPNNPSLYDPLRHFDQTKKRQERLLGILTRNEVIEQTEADQEAAQLIQLTVKKKEAQYPVYSTYILAELRALIAQADGFEDSLARAKSDADVTLINTRLDQKVSEVLGQGVVIETALNPKKQQRDEERVTALLTAEGLEAGAAVIDNSNREIVSLYGGKNYHKADFNRSYQAVRQPGSAIKPLLVYAPLFETTSYNEDTPINSSNICVGKYCPTNIGGAVYGNVSIRQAFSHSHNTAAVRLFQMVGVEEGFKFLEPFKFRAVTEKDHNLAAALGGFSKGVTPLELADAYTSFINGIYTPAHAIRSVKDQQGNVKYSWPEKEYDMWSSRTVSKIKNLMGDTVKNGTGRGVATTTTYTGVKTGTTDNYKDIWAAGMNDNYTAAVWLGYDKPKSIQWASNQKLHLKTFSTLLKD